MFAATAAALAASLTLASPAAGIVTFDPATGTGFVGKGDLQTVFEWNNKALQTRLNGRLPGGLRERDILDLHKDLHNRER